MRGVWCIALVATWAWAPGAAAQPARDPPSWTEWAGGAALLANAFALDAAAYDYVGAPSRPGGLGRLAYGVGNLWELWPYAVGVTAVGTLFDRRAPRIGLEIAGGVVVAAAAGELVKRAAGRERPRTTDDPWRFDAWSGQASFPSGHAVAAFAVAGAVAAETQNVWVRGGAFALAGLVGWGRVESRAHWYSDVVAGALLGATVAHRTTRALRGGRGRPARVRITPLVWGDAVGLAVQAPWSATSWF